MVASPGHRELAMAVTTRDPNHDPREASIFASDVVIARSAVFWGGRRRP
jgi:hypothetical protein